MKENEIVKTVRTNERLTQEEFGAKFGISGSAISNIESGKRGVNSEIMNYCLDKLSIEPISRRDIVKRIMQNHIGTYNSFIDSNGCNHFEELVDELTLFV